MMRRAREFLFRPMHSNEEQQFPFSRWDILLSVVFGFTLMVTLAYTAELGGWSLKRGLIIVGCVLCVLCASQNRKATIGGAFGLVSFRAAIGALVGPHNLAFLAIAIITGFVAYVLLRGLK